MTPGRVKTGIIGQDVTPLFKKVFELSADPMLVVLMENYMVVDANPAACQLFGYSHRQFCALRYASLGPDPVFFRQALVKKLSAASGVEHMGMEGQSFFADVSFEYLENENRQVCLVVLRNVKDQAQIASEKKQLEEIAMEVMHTDSAYFLGEDQERKRLGKELHGHIGPMLVSVKLAMEKSLAGERESVSREDLQKILKKQAMAIKALREVTTRLAEGYQYQEDINIALRTLLDKISEFGDMEMDCEMDTLPDNVPMATRYHLFRILEEALTNIIKHADATRIQVRLKIQNNVLSLLVEDDGGGADKPMSRSGSGLPLMQKRAALLNGKLHYESVAGKYFKLELSVPIKPGKE
jgi:signal transduction histidine kinase